MKEVLSRNSNIREGERRSHWLVKFMSIEFVTKREEKKSGDLLNKLKNTDIRNKNMASIKIKSLYTNLPIDKWLH